MINCLAELRNESESSDNDTKIKASHTILVLGGNQAFRSDAEILAISNTSSICTKPADIPDIFSKGAIGTYFNGKVLLCGGWLAGTQCNEYNFLAHQWLPVPYFLTTERAEAAEAMLQNGSWIVIGGKGLDGTPLFSTEIFNNDLFVSNFIWPQAISGHCVKKINESHIFLAGGETHNETLLDTVYFMNVESSFWLSLEERLKYSRRGHVCGIVGNDIIVAGGQKVVETELLDLKSMRIRSGPNLPFEMDWASSVQVDNTFVIVGGEHIGYCSKPGMCFSSNSLFKIDIKHDAWLSSGQELKLPRSKHIVLEINNKEIAEDLCQQNCPTCKGES